MRNLIFENTLKEVESSNYLLLCNVNHFSNETIIDIRDISFFSTPLIYENTGYYCKIQYTQKEYVIFFPSFEAAMNALNKWVKYKNNKQIQHV